MTPQILPISVQQCWVTYPHYHAWLSHGAQELTSGPQARATSALPTVLSAQPLLWLWHFPGDQGCAASLIHMLPTPVLFWRNAWPVSIHCLSKSSSAFYWYWSVWGCAYFATDIVDDTELDSNHQLVSFCHYDPVPNILSMAALLWQKTMVGSMWRTMMAGNKRNGWVVSFFIPKCTPNGIISLLSVLPLTGAEPSPKHQQLGLNSSVPLELRNMSVPKHNICFKNVFEMPSHALFVYREKVSLCGYG